ncbi:MAG: hypothetical protein N3A58_06390 [Spirochaetes bacterium]|nr:hypothetical protein [Spirochaetota bacterium]
MNLLSCKSIGFYKSISESFVNISYRLFTNKDLNIIFGVIDKISVPLFSQQIENPISNFFSILTPFDILPEIKKSEQITLYPCFLSLTVLNLLENKLTDKIDIIDLYNIFKQSLLYCFEEKVIYKSLSLSSINLISIYKFNQTIPLMNFLMNHINYNEKKLYETIEKYKNKEIGKIKYLNLNFGYFFLFKNQNTFEKNKILIFSNKKELIKIKIHY